MALSYRSQYEEMKDSRDTYYGLYNSADSRADSCSSEKSDLDMEIWRLENQIDKLIECYTKGYSTCNYK